jgi:predicted RNA-binding protein YlqC (UPF0109 family)
VIGKGGRIAKYLRTILGAIAMEHEIKFSPEIVRGFVGV